MNNYNVVYLNSLSHHGISGQKWGHRNGPPYPLDKSDYSSAERKAMTGDTKSTRSKSGNKINKDTIKKVAIGVGVTAAVAGGAYLAIRNKDAVAAFISAQKKVPISEFKRAKDAAIKRGLSTVNDIMSAGKEFAKAKKLESDATWARRYLGKSADFIGPMPNVSPEVLRSFKTKTMTKEALSKIMPGTGDSLIKGIAEGKNRAVKAIGGGLAMLGIKECADIVLGKNTSGKIYKANDKDSIGKFWRYEEPTKETKNREG